MSFGFGQQQQKISIDLNNSSELLLDDSNQGQEEFERQRILKGTRQRLKEKRPSLFDLFYINTGSISNEYLPSICASYVFLDPEAISKYTGIKSPKTITDQEISAVKDLCQYFESVDKYWEYLIIILDDKLTEEPEIDLITPFNSDIIKFVDEVSVDELEQYITRIETQLLKNDLEEYQEFYKQLIRRLKFIFATSWHDRFHNALLKKITKELPARNLVQVKDDTSKIGENSAVDVLANFYTKNQRKYRTKVLQQEDGIHKFNKAVKDYFDMRGKIQFENAKRRLISNNQIEGLQYWGDDEEEFHDLVPLHYRTTENMMLPDYEGVVYKGYDWNEYNRVRFNLNHKPPKTIRGYYWKIFYPRLKNKNIAPKYRIDASLLKNTDEPVPDTNYKYTCIVFEAGPPYLAIAFRIVDKEFDIYRNNGVVSEFVNGIFTFQIAFKASLYFKGYTPEQLY